MVTGGTSYSHNDHLDSTEVLVQGGQSWKNLKSATLPFALRALRVISVGNEVFSTGEII